MKGCKKKIRKQSNDFKVQMELQGSCTKSPSQQRGEEECRSGRKKKKKMRSRLSDVRRRARNGQGM